MADKLLKRFMVLVADNIQMHTHFLEPFLNTEVGVVLQIIVSVLLLQF